MIKLEDCKRSCEILAAAEMLYESKHYRDINFKQISQITSFSRSTIYNYFESKEEIFLSLLIREYKYWIADLESFQQHEPQASGIVFANFLANSLEKRNLMLKLLANNISDFEEGSRLEMIVLFKESYLKLLTTLRNNFKYSFPDLVEEEIEEILFAFMPFLFGLYPYTVRTEKQKEAFKELGVEVPLLRIYPLTMQFLHQLLPI